MSEDKPDTPDYEVPPQRQPPPRSGEEDPRPGELPKAVRQRLEALIPEMVKKTFAAGLGAVFTTEEGIRRLTRDLSLPKEMAGYLASTAGSTKDEIIRIIAREVRDFLHTVNLSEEVAKLLTTLSFEIKTEIRFIPNDEKYGSGVKPDVRANVRLKKTEERTTKRRRRRRRRVREEEDGQEGGSQEGGSGDEHGTQHGHGHQHQRGDTVNDAELVNDDE